MAGSLAHLVLRGHDFPPFIGWHHRLEPSSGLERHVGWRKNLGGGANLDWIETHVEVCWPGEFASLEISGSCELAAIHTVSLTLDMTACQD